MPEPKQDNSIELLPSGESERFYLEQFMGNLTLNGTERLKSLPKQGMNC